MSFGIPNTLADVQATHTATKADVDPKDHRVLVDAGGQVKLCSITQYEQSTSPEVCPEYGQN